MIRKILPVQLCRTSLLGLSLCFGHAMAAPGDLDLTFGQDGVMLVNLNGGQEHFSALLAQPDGSVLAAGALYHRDPVEAVQSGYDMSIVRVLRDGQLENSAPFHSSQPIPTLKASRDSTDTFSWSATKHRFS